MENDDQQVTVCAACDLAARLRSELTEARNQLLAHDSELSIRAARGDGEDAVACVLHCAAREQELRIAAIDAIVAELCCDCGADGLSAVTECTDAAA